MSLLLLSGYSHAKKDAKKEYRELIFAECAALACGQIIEIVCNDGKVRNARVTGAVKTWKTRTGDLRVPCKYGLYEGFYIDFRNGRLTGIKPVVPA